MKIKELARKNILRLKPYKSARGENMEGLLLDANENPYNINRGVCAIEGLNRYPDPNQRELRIKIGECLGLPPVNLFCGVGSDEIIDLLIRIFCEPGKDEAIIVEPTYGMYKVACDINNVKTDFVPLTGSFQIDLLKTINSFNVNTKLLFLCSPNNPTGNLLEKRDILTIVKEFNGIVIVDEAYIDFSERGTILQEIENYDNLVVVRTFSKAWGLAGLRCGYCAASEEIIDLLFKIKSPYSLNTATSRIVVNALNEREKKGEIVSIIIEERERVANAMMTLKGIEKVYPSDSNFLLIKCVDSKRILTYLKENGIIIRDRSAEFGLADCLRVTIGTRDENELLLKKLSEAL